MEKTEMNKRCFSKKSKTFFLEMGLQISKRGSNYGGFLRLRRLAGRRQ